MLLAQGVQVSMDGRGRSTSEIAVTQQELQDTLLEVLDAVSSEWIREQVEGAVDQVVPYVVGEADHFVVELSLADVVEPAGPVIARLVERKLGEAYNALPECSVRPFSRRPLPGSGRSRGADTGVQANGLYR